MEFILILWIGINALSDKDSMALILSPAFQTKPNVRLRENRRSKPSTKVQRRFAMCVPYANKHPW